MSDDTHPAEPAAEPAHEPVHTIEHIHDTTHDVVHDHDNGRPSWLVRLVLSVGGIFLLAAALAAWQMQGLLGGYLGVALPWLIFGAVILAAAAIVESITTEVWVTLIAGIFLLAAAYIVTGRVNVQLDQQSHAAYITDRFTGEIRICNVHGCRDLAGFGGPSVNITLPKVEGLRRPKPAQ